MIARFYAVLRFLALLSLIGVLGFFAIATFVAAEAERRRRRAPRMDDAGDPESIAAFDRATRIGDTE